MIAPVPEWRATPRAYPFASADMPAFLLFQPLAEHLHEFVPAVFLQRRLLFWGQLLLKLLYQPFQRDLLALWIHGGYLTVEGGKGAVIAVKKAFILNQRHAGQMVEVLDGGLHNVGAQGLQQGQVFLHGYRQATFSQMIEEIEQHAGSPESATCTRHGTQPLQQGKVLFILQQGARQFWQISIVSSHLDGRYCLAHQQLQPVEKFGRGGLLLQPRNFTQGEETV